MMSASQMNRMADDAAKRAKRNGLKPVPYPLGDHAPAIPFLGDYVPKGYRRVDAPNPPRLMGCEDGYLFVDASGWGADDEPALTQAQFQAYAEAHPGLLFGVTEAGQFQVVVGVYQKGELK